MSSFDAHHAAAHSRAWHDRAVQELLKSFETVNEAMADPEVGAAFETAFRAAYSAIETDPVAHERQEAARLLALMKERYTGPGLNARYIGEEMRLPTMDEGLAPGYVHPMSRTIFTGTGGIGFWHIEGDMPDDLRAVFSLAASFGSIDKSTTVSGRIWAAKRLLALLQAAQRACGEEPEPMALSGLSPTHELILLVLYRCKALDTLNAVKRVDVAGRLDLHHYTVKKGLAALREFGLVAALGIRAAMRYHLTPTGAACGAYLDRKK